MSANRVSQSRSGLNGGAAERPVSTCMRTLSANAHAARRCNVLLRSSIFELCAPNPFSCSAALRFFHHFLHPLLYRYSRALTFVLPSLFRTRPDLLLLPLLFLLLLLLLPLLSVIFTRSLLDESRASYLPMKTNVSGDACSSFFFLASSTRSRDIWMCFLARKGWVGRGSARQ